MKKFSIIFTAIIFIIILFTTLSAEAATYQVQRGDSLWKISNQFDIPIQIIIEKNEISNPTDLYVGQRLIITSSSKSITINFGTNSQNTASSTTYYVRSGDTLWKLAQKFNTNVEKLKKLNTNIADDYRLEIGQRLIIPAENSSEIVIDEQYNDNNYNPGNNNDNSNNKYYTYYTIKPGDILWNIARKYNTSVDKLVELNKIKNSYDLYVGRRLLVEVEEDKGGTVVDRPNLNRPDYSNYNFTPYYFHNMAEGETLWGIADYYGVRVSTVIAENDITDINQLKTGDLIIIPLKNSNKYSYLKKMSNKVKNYYRVNSNENLAGIAEYYGLSEIGLRTINNISPDREARLGQRLLMPVNPTFFKKHELYTVKENNKPLHEIAYEKSLSIRSILRANYMKDVNAKFSAGTLLLIPLDTDSKANWIDYKDGKPVNSLFSN